MGEEGWGDEGQRTEDAISDKVELSCFRDTCAAEDHGSRIIPFKASQVAFGRRGAAAMAFRQRSTLIRGSGFGDSRWVSVADVAIMG
jgi:hypothetical protein